MFLASFVCMVVLTLLSVALIIKHATLLISSVTDMGGKLAVSGWLQGLRDLCRVLLWQHLASYALYFGLPFWQLMIM